MDEVAGTSDLYYMRCSLEVPVPEAWNTEMTRRMEAQTNGDVRVHMYTETRRCGMMSPAKYCD